MVEKTPDLYFYYSQKSSLIYQILAKCETATQNVTPTFDIFSDPDLKNKIGYVTQQYLTNGAIQNFSTSVLFTVFKGSFCYSHVQSSTESFTSPQFFDTIVYGNDDLYKAKGSVVTIQNDNSNTVSVYVYLDK